MKLKDFQDIVLTVLSDPRPNIDPSKVHEIFGEISPNKIKEFQSHITIDKIFNRVGPYVQKTFTLLGRSKSLELVYSYLFYTNKTYIDWENDLNNFYDYLFDKLNKNDLIIRDIIMFEKWLYNLKYVEGKMVFSIPGVYLAPGVKIGHFPFKSEYLLSQYTPLDRLTESYNNDRSYLIGKWEEEEMKIIEINSEIYEVLDAYDPNDYFLTLIENQQDLLEELLDLEILIKVG